MSDRTIEGKDVNEVLRLVLALTPFGDAQLSILAYALLAACQSAGVSKTVVLAQLTDLFDQEFDLVELADVERWTH